MQNLKIMTPTGWKEFDGLRRHYHEESLRFIIGPDLKNSKSICVARKHIFIVNDKEVFAENVILGDKLGTSKVLLIQEVEEGQWLYDPINVKGGELYIHDNDIISHNSFQNTSSTLISGEFLLKLKAQEAVKVSGDVTAYELPKEKSSYVMTVDTGRGRGQDYSTFSVIDITAQPFKQVCVFRSNDISPIVFPDVVYKFAKHYNNAYLIIESNDLGATVYKTVFYEHEYDNIYSGAIKKGVSFGLEMSSKVKRQGCSNLKDLIEQGKLEIPDKETIKELCVFEVSKQSYAAKDGFHDDMVMSLVMFAWFVETTAFGNISDKSMRFIMSAEKDRLVEDSVPSFGIITNSGIDSFAVETVNGRRVQYVKDDFFGWATTEHIQYGL